MTSATHKWIVLPPSLEREAWRQAILDEAGRVGVEVLDWSEDLRPPQTEALILTTDVNIARTAGVADDDITAIALPPYIDLDGCMSDGDVHARVNSVSEKILGAHDFARRRNGGFDGLPIISALPQFSAASLKPIASRPLMDREIALQKAAEVFLGGEAKWPVGLFSYDRRNAETAPRSGHLDVTGRPRFLVTGPYLWMPAGTWRAVVTLSFDADVSHRKFRVDWGGVETFASQEFHPGHSGIFEITLEHHWDTAAAAELRVLVLEGVFHGAMGFRGATVSRVEDAAHLRG